MKLGKKKLQELKNRRISIENLYDRYDRYFINSQYKIEVENILKLLNENICSFKEIVDKCKSIKNKDNKPCLYLLLQNRELFEELIEKNKLTKEDLRYLLNEIDDSNEAANLSKNTVLLRHIVDKDIVSFKDLVNNFKNFNELHSLLRNKELFEELIQNNKLNTEDLEYLLNTIDKAYELDNLNENTILLKSMMDNNVVSFKELVDTFKSIKKYFNEPCLKDLLNNKKFFEDLFENKKLAKDDLRYLLDKIDNTYELYELCHNTSLIKYILNEFVLDTKDVDKLNRIIENNSWCKDRDTHTIFEYIEDHNEDNEEILKLNDLNRYACSIDDDQRLELAEILKDSEVAQNTLIQIIDNNLEDQYDFESLKNLLTKDDKKKKITLNF